MADPEEQPEQPKAVQQKLVIANKVTGTVKWFNVKSGYGFINRNDTKEDVFVHQSAIVKNNPRKAVRSVGDGEVVEFDVVIGEKGHEAANVTGPYGGAVKGSPYAADKRRGYRAVHWYINQKRGNARTQRKPREGQEGYESGEAKTDDETNAGEQGSAPGQQRRYRVRRQYDGYYRGSRRTGPSALQPDSSGEVGEQEAEGTGEGGVTRGGGRGRGGPTRRHFRPNYRGGRGPGPSRRPRSQGGQVTGEGEGIVVPGAIGSIGVIETIGGSRGGARGWSRGGAARGRYGRRMPQQRHPRATSCERAIDRGNRRYGSDGLTFLPVSHRPPAPITDTFAEASDSLLKSEQKSDAPKDKDAPAAAPPPQESQPVQNTTTESTA